MNEKLKKQSDFDFVFKKGKRIFTNSLTLIYIEEKTLKFGISVSKKHGHAVVRNRIKRLIRASFIKYKKEIVKKCFIVVLPKIKEEYSFQRFDGDLKFSLIKSGIINDK